MALRPSESKHHDHALLSHLYRQAGRRWFILLVTLALLAWLMLFAGEVRNPGGVKRQWAVVASRVMAAAGGILLVRLLLFSYERRVPVILVRTGDQDPGGKLLITVFGLVERLRSKGFELVPLVDVVMFMDEQRYVPKRCLGLVIEAAGPGKVQSILKLAGRLELTILLPPASLYQSGPGAWAQSLPENIALGATLTDGPPLNGGVHPQTEVLKSFSQKAWELLGKRPICARLGEGFSPEIWTTLKSTGYRCILNGTGFNRYGDQAHMVRLLDITWILRRGSKLELNLAACLGLFRGRYVWWPVAALTGIFRD